MRTIPARQTMCPILAATALAFAVIAMAPGCHEEETLAPSYRPYQAWTLIDHTDCKSQTDSGAVGTIPSDMDCIEYHYGANGTLAIKHINAGFNCCPGDITADVIVAAGVITIVEHEAQSGCRCLCLLDVDYEIHDLEPRQYALRVVELYVNADDERLDFSIDLSAAPGRFLARYRDHYPWAYESTMPVDKSVLDGMRDEITAVIGTPSCEGGADCRSVPLGVKPCGGPREYLIYSSATVDENALAFMVSRYNAFNDAFNRRYDIVSDCLYVLPPAIGCEGRLCTRVDRQN
jgi:hypothetical protein